MTHFSLTTHRSDETAVLSVAGELDLATVPALRKEALELLASPDCNTLVLDLRDLTFLDSTGLGCWVEIHNHANRNGKTFRLRSLPGSTLRTLTIGGLGGLFDIEASPAEPEGHDH